MLPRPLQHLQMLAIRDQSTRPRELRAPALFRPSQLSTDATKSMTLSGTAPPFPAPLLSPQLVGQPPARARAQSVGSSRSSTCFTSTSRHSSSSGASSSLGASASLFSAGLSRGCQPDAPCAQALGPPAPAAPLRAARWGVVIATMGHIAGDPPDAPSLGPPAPATPPPPPAPPPLFRVYLHCLRLWFPKAALRQRRRFSDANATAAAGSARLADAATLAVWVRNRGVAERCAAPILAVAGL